MKKMPYWHLKQIVRHNFGGNGKYFTIEVTDDNSILEIGFYGPQARIRWQFPFPVMGPEEWEKRKILFAPVTTKDLLKLLYHLVNKKLERDA